MKTDYLAAMAASYAHQKHVLRMRLGQGDKPVKLLLGFQPMGITLRQLPDEQWEIAVAAYFNPAIMTALLRRTPADLYLQIVYIRGANVPGQEDTVRVFPGAPLSGDLPRAQTVLWGDDGELWAGRNGECQFVHLDPPVNPLAPSAKAEGRWTAGPWLRLSGEDRMVHSLNHDGRGIITVESNRRLDRWTICRYARSADGVFTLAYEQVCNPWVYGVHIDQQDGAIWTVTDHRCADQPYGIYRNNQLVVPGVIGNGLVFLPNNQGMLLTYYGESSPRAVGEPGALIYVSPRQLGLG